MLVADEDSRHRDQVSRIVCISIIGDDYNWERMGGKLQEVDVVPGSSFRHLLIPAVVLGSDSQSANRHQSG
jgi:hypothetical protein